MRLRAGRNACLAIVIAAIWSSISPGAVPAFAQEAEPPPLAAMVRSDTIGNALWSLGRAAGRPDCASADVCYDLSVDYVDGVLRNPTVPLDPANPATGYDKVRLRNYVGSVVREGQIMRNDALADATPFMAPIVEVFPGESFRLTLHNKLPKQEDMILPYKNPDGSPARCVGHPADHNTPHCSNFNITNMHSHGIWTSPDGNGDNVLLSVNPGVSFQYEYNIPKDHPSGTFWYHSHRHGSTAPQVSSGMAGVLLVRGDRKPQLSGSGWQTGDIDILLPDGAVSERVMLFQQIAYACRDSDGKIKTVAGSTVWRCDEGDIGMVEPGPKNAFDQLGPQSWTQSGRFTAINGEVMADQPKAVAGRLERWRLAHGGVRGTIKLQIRKATSADPTMADGVARVQTAAAADDDTLTEQAMEENEEQVVSELCGGEPIPTLGIATDGLTRNRLDERQVTWLQPGYREDLLVQFPASATTETYCIIDDAIAAQAAVNGKPNSPRLIGWIEVQGSGSAQNIASGEPQDIIETLVSVAQKIFSGPARDRIVEELRARSLAAFVPHPSLAEAKINEIHTVGFAIGAPGFPGFTVGNLEKDAQAGYKLVKADAYSPSRIDHKLVLGNTDEWQITAFQGGTGHPFHIHVNPFEIISIKQYNPRANCAAYTPPTTEPDTCQPDNAIKPDDPSTWKEVSGAGDPAVNQYANLQGQWKDTIFARPGFLITTRTQYRRYIGAFVLHCHILDHEDQGMMQNVAIYIPDGKGGYQSPMDMPDAHHSHQ